MKSLVIVLLALVAGAAAAEPAKFQFSAVTGPTGDPPAAFGSYAKGCLAGGEALPVDGPGWQAMRLGRNRNWGHPAMIAFIERLAAKAQDVGWPGILVGDISQPRGGPMKGGHRSHQIGIDADIWLRPGVARRLSRAERRDMSSDMVVRRDRMAVNGRWRPEHALLLRAASEDPAVARIFVNAAIKKKLCETEGPAPWLRKLRPWWGHDAHFHVRLSCPDDSPGCVNQDPPPEGAGCGAELDWWFTDEALHPKPSGKKRAELTLADLPPACRQVLSAE